MTKKEYFSQLISLYEATNNVNMDVEDQKIYGAQNQIADSGSDVNPNNLGGSATAPEEMAQEPDTQDSDGLQDAAYLNNYSASNDASATTVSDNRQKLVELFDLFRNLLDYSEKFAESMESVELELLDDNAYTKAIKVIGKVKDLSEKIRNYLLNTFENDAYEKALYAYIMLRTELLTAIKLLRDILKLNEVEEIPEKKK